MRVGERRRVPTPAQTAIVQSLADGWTTRETAARLGVTYETVRTHAANVTRRVGATNMNHVVAIGFREGWLS